MKLLGHHNSPHDSIDEEREKDIAQEDQDPHQYPDEQLLRGVHDEPVEADQSGYHPHGCSDETGDRETVLS